MIQNKTTSIITAIYFVYAQEVNTYSIVGNVLSIELHSGFAWKPITGSIPTYSFTETEEAVEAGKMYKQNLNLSVVGVDAVVSKELTELTNRKLLLKIEYSNETARVIGSPDVPAFKLVSSSSSKFVQKNALDFSCNAAIPAPFVG